MATVIAYPEMLTNLRVILASKSPRRLDVLQRMGFKNIEIVGSEFAENLDKSQFAHPSLYAKENAIQKGREVATARWKDAKKASRDGIIIAADTVVCFENQILEKPKDSEDAKKMLRQLTSLMRKDDSIPGHQVITGVALFTQSGGYENPATVFHTTSVVKFGSVENHDIEEYVATGEPLDKAGSYGIQGMGASMIQSIEGCFFNVQGLPLYDLSKHIVALSKKGVLTNTIGPITSGNLQTCRTAEMDTSLPAQDCTIACHREVDIDEDDYIKLNEQQIKSTCDQSNQRFVMVGNQRCDQQEFDDDIVGSSITTSDTSEDVESDDDELDDDDFIIVEGLRRKNGGGAGSSKALASNRILARLNMEQIGGGGVLKAQQMSHSVTNAIKQGEAKSEAPRNRGLTRDSRATVEQVLDLRTIQLLEKLMKWGVFKELYGCVSTGKEANVYLGIIQKNDHKKVQRAIKVFKTSILVFKDRARYVEGEFRFRRGYAGSSNPRKMVRQWAEKEYRNLKRLTLNAIRCPLPVELRGHIIAMSFLGTDDGKAAPKIKGLLQIKSQLPSSFWRRLYVETIVIMRLLYQECKLVHGDFSEYNLLFHEGHPYVIDVSQSVEGDHPHAFNFLKRDCFNINRFYKKVLMADSDWDDEEKDALDGDKASSESIIQLPPPKYELDDEMLKVILIGEEICGYKLKAQWPVFPIQTLFEYVTKADFLQIDENRESEWVEFDVEEKSKILDVETRTTERPAGHYTIKQKPMKESKGKRKTKQNVNFPLEEASKLSTETKERQKDNIKYEIASTDEKVRIDHTVNDAKIIVVDASKVSTTTEAVQRSTHSRVTACLDENSLNGKRQYFRSLCVATLHQLYEQLLYVNGDEEDKRQKEVNEQVFLNTWTPSSLQQVNNIIDLEEELERQKKGTSGKFLPFLAPDRSPIEEEEGEVNGDFDTENDHEGQTMMDDNHDPNKTADMLSRGKIPEGVDPKEWKKLVKAEKKEKRKTKIPKYIKKKKTKSRK